MYVNKFLAVVFALSETSLELCSILSALNNVISPIATINLGCVI